MDRINVCRACLNERSGVKTRIAILHTCGTNGIIDDEKFNAWMDRCNMRGANIPIHIKYKMYHNQTKQQ